MDYLDSEIIIMTVQNHPCLYDRNNPDYKNRDVKREAWVEVTSVVVGELWSKIDNEKKTNIGKLEYIYSIH